MHSMKSYTITKSFMILLWLLRTHIWPNMGTKNDINNGTKKLRTAWFLLLKCDSFFISIVCSKALKKVWNLEVLREISFSLFPLKQKRWLNPFVLSPFAKLLRYEISDFHGLKYKSNSTWNQDPVDSMHTNLTWKITVSRPKNWAEDPQNCAKKIKKS